MFWLIASLYMWELVCLFLGERGGLCLESGRWALLHYCGNLLCLASVSIQDFFSSSSGSVWGRMKVYISWFVCLKSGIVEKETCFVRRLLLCEARSNFLSLLFSFRFCFLLHWEGDLVCETQAQLSFPCFSSRMSPSLYGSASFWSTSWRIWIEFWSTLDSNSYWIRMELRH